MGQPAFGLAPIGSQQVRRWVYEEIHRCVPASGADRARRGMPTAVHPPGSCDLISWRGVPAGGRPEARSADTSGGGVTQEADHDQHQYSQHRGTVERSTWVLVDGSPHHLVGRDRGARAACLYSKDSAEFDPTWTQSSDRAPTSAAPCSLARVRHPTR